jgi:hypothetical protein
MMVVLRIPFQFGRILRDLVLCLQIRAKRVIHTCRRKLTFVVLWDLVRCLRQAFYVVLCNVLVLGRTCGFGVLLGGRLESSTAYIGREMFSSLPTYIYVTFCLFLHLTCRECRIFT